MTDRTISLLVTLDKEYREDDAQTIINAIGMLKCVEDVTINKFSSQEHMTAYSIKQQLRRDFFAKAYELFEGF